MKRNTLLVLSLVVLAIFAATVYAADMSGTSSSSAMSSASSSTAANQVFKASDLIGADVRNMQGENLGKISDLAINQKGNIAFAVISHGGALGIGAKYIPVPITALQIEQNGKLARLDISKEKLDSAPSFTANNWPDMSNKKWTEDTYRYYGVSPTFEGGTSGMPQDMMHQKTMPKSGQY